MIKKILKKIYHAYKRLRSKYRDYRFVYKMKLRAFKNRKIIKEIYKTKPLKILTPDETLKLIKNGKSIARFGDGEFDSILMKPNAFEKPDSNLSKHLYHVLRSKSDKCLISVSIFLQDMTNKNAFSRGSWSDYIINKRDKILDLISDDVRLNYCFGDASCTRPYFDSKHRNRYCKKYFSLFKEIWNNKDVVIVEGEKTRFGCGNDLLDNTKSVKRILCPAKGAYSSYDSIIDYIKKYVSKECLVLIALGPTATCLAYDLAYLGYHAIDIGHIDIEYEWYLRKAKRKMEIPNKYTSEARHGDNPLDYTEKTYVDSILTVIS